MMTRSRHTVERLSGLIGVIFFLAVWEFSARVFWHDPTILPAPSQAIFEAIHTLTAAELGQDVGISLFRIFVGFALAAVAGVTIGILCGWSRWMAAITRPFIEILRPVPPLAWIPMAIIWFGLGESSKIFVIFLGGFFPIFTSAWHGVAEVSPVLVRAARTMDVNGLALLLKVTIPAALPDIATGLRIGLGLSFGILVAAELIAAQSGIGYLIMQGRVLGHLGISIFGVFLIGLASLLADYQLDVVLRRTVGRWTSI